MKMILNISDFETWKIVAKVCVKYGADVDRTQDDFFNDLLSKYDGELTAEALTEWLDTEIPKHFRVFDERPIWIQDPQWLYHDGRPMIFVGQILLDNPPASLLHDGTKFYLFIPQGRWSDADIRVVSQQF